MENRVTKSDILPSVVFVFDLSGQDLSTIYGGRK
jgi:hypothetical protein